MEFLKELLGDKYEEFKELIGDTKLILDDGKLIPKSRFDEVNNKWKSAKKQLEEYEATNLTTEEQLKAMKLNMSKLKARELFAKAGLSEEEYETLVDNIANENEEITVNMANSMINIIQSKKEQIEKTIKEEMIKDTPKPPAGGESTRKPTMAEMLAKQANETITTPSLWD